MLTLYEILQNAQGGQALDNLAAQFNITPEAANAAVKAIVPALSEGILKQTSEPAAIGSFLSILGEGHYLAAFSDPAAAQAAAGSTSESLSGILGSSQAREEIILRAASASGISQQVLAQMLPVIASMIFGGLTKSLETQGFGGLLGQLANAAGTGGLGTILGQILGGHPAPPPPPPPPSPSPAGGLGGLGSILGSILGGGRSAGAPGPGSPAWPQPEGQGGLGGILGSILSQFGRKPSPGPAPSPSPDTTAPGGISGIPGFDAQSIKASLEALTKMLQPGTPPPPPPKPETPPQAGQQTDIIAEIDRIIGGKGG